jgi:clan AA aspartic protease (TIGR02281 family)
MKVDLKVGTIERKNFAVTVQDELPVDPLLGQTFFNAFVYTIDNGSNSIHFQKKHKTALAAGGSNYGGSSDRYAVPFTREGNEIIVQVDVNGRATPMYFDTGASGITFSRQQADQLKLRIPEDAIASRHTGVGGDTIGQAFPVGRMKMGPIDKSNIQVSVIDQSNMRYPLLGQTFFGDWQFTIDDQQHVIRFVRR